MHDYGELAGERHLCLLHAGAFGKPHRPALEGCAALQRLGQDDVAGLVERRSHSLVADLADPSPIRPANRLGVVAPTFSPKPRNRPRRLICTSNSFDCTSLRAVNNARISCAAIDLQCTGRNQPSRISCTIPRASLRSLLTGIVSRSRQFDGCEIQIIDGLPDWKASYKMLWGGSEGTYPSLH